ncbi:hypothetical protein QR680_014421 [Steinernema hermaphroditum]|uniref:Uncharacterized protein n=1 Tax=Steinernema hermaphroditum TaxID=289476 RepID=A0AA39M473_9BILA|nr:hypothetical protein QR680_014421 [Steinernema hermaphroditum]
MQFVPVDFIERCLECCISIASQSKQLSGIWGASSSRYKRAHRDRCDIHLFLQISPNPDELLYAYYPEEPNFVGGKLASLQIGGQKQKWTSKRNTICQTEACDYLGKIYNLVSSETELVLMNIGQEDEHVLLGLLRSLTKSFVNIALINPFRLKCVDEIIVHFNACGPISRFVIRQHEKEKIHNSVWKLISKLDIGSLKLFTGKEHVSEKSKFVKDVIKIWKKGKTLKTRSIFLAERELLDSQANWGSVALNRNQF